MKNTLKQSAATVALVAFTATQVSPAMAQSLDAPIYDPVSAIETITTTVSQNETIYDTGTAIVDANPIVYSDVVTQSVTTTAAGQVDYGNAPVAAGYGTPSHVIVPGIRLGTLIDADSGPAATPGNPVGGDADGVRLTAGSTSGEAATGVASVQGAGGYLQGWFDWDSSGTFDVDEQIASNLQDLDGDGIITFSVAPSADATTGTTFARFRWSTEANLGPDGQASDGEVEDYRFIIGASPTPNSVATYGAPVLQQPAAVVSTPVTTVTTPVTTVATTPVTTTVATVPAATAPVVAPATAPVVALPTGLSGSAVPLLAGALGVAAIGAILIIANDDDNATSTQ